MHQIWLSVVLVANLQGGRKCLADHVLLSDWQNVTGPKLAGNGHGGIAYFRSKLEPEPGFIVRSGKSFS